MLPAVATLALVMLLQWVGLLHGWSPRPKCICAPLQAAVEYFRLMLPPWDAKGLCNEWEKMAVRLLRAPNDQGTAMHLLQSCVCIARQSLGWSKNFITELTLRPCTPNCIDISRSCLSVG